MRKYLSTHAHYMYILRWCNMVYVEYTRTDDNLMGQQHS